MPLYVDREHLERTREALNAAAHCIEYHCDKSYPGVMETLEKIAAALASTSHATDYMTQPVADYVPTAKTITEAAAPAGPAAPTPKEN